MNKTTKMVMVLAVASILPFAMSGMDKAYASSFDAYDRVSVNGSEFTDSMDICDLTRAVSYTITNNNSANTKSVSWANAPDTVTCSGTVYTMNTAVVTFEQNNTNGSTYTISNPQSVSSVTLTNASSHNHVVEITITYSN